MPRVKIVWVESIDLSDGDTKRIIREMDENDFEEITPEELQQLRANRYRLPRPSYNLEPYILVLEDKPIAASLGSIKEFLKKEEAAREAQRKKREMAKKKRAQTVLERKKAQLAKLKKELGEE